MTVVLLPAAELQFLDQNGAPFSGGTLAMYVPGTTTPKDTWQDQAGTVLNANPIVLDAAGRCIVWGDGVYRTVLSDVDGNLVWDQLSTTIVSSAMAPVVMAPTIAEAVRLLGIQDLIDAEATARSNADNALQGQINSKANQSDLTAEINRAQAAETNLQNELNAEIARAEAAEANLQSQIDGHSTAITADQTRRGTATTGTSGGATTVVYDNPFPMNTTQVFCQLVSTLAAGVGWVVPSNITATGFDAIIWGLPTESSLTGVSIGPIDGTFHYLAYGS